MVPVWSYFKLGIYLNTYRYGDQCSGAGLKARLRNTDNHTYRILQYIGTYLFSVDKDPSCIFGRLSGLINDFLTTRHAVGYLACQITGSGSLSRKQGPDHTVGTGTGTEFALFRIPVRNSGNTGFLCSFSSIWGFKVYKSCGAGPILTDSGSCLCGRLRIKNIFLQIL